MRDDSLLLILVPELAQVTQERYNILHQISLLSPVGRHLLNYQNPQCGLI